MDVTFAALAEQVGAAFTVDTSGGPVTITLASARPLDTASTGGRGTLVFTGPATAPLTQGTYPIRPNASSADESAPLFLVPVAEHDGVLEYEAVFN